MTLSNKPVAYITREASGGSAPELLLQGILSETEKLGQNLVVFRGGLLGKDPGSKIYDLINSSYHGLITWASSDADAFTTSYYKRYDKLPVVTLTLQIPPYPVVSADSYAGMRTVIEHLIQVHRKRKIIFIRGPETHASAKERYQAYVDVLKEQGLALDEALVSPYCTWGKNEGPAMAKRFLDEKKLQPGKDFQAIACVNDNIAIGMIEALQARGIRVPEDVAVTGCNDAFEARALTPPVTTVSLPNDKQIAKALEVVNQAASGQRPAAETTLPARLVLGQSCGCLSHKVVAAASALSSVGSTGLFGRLARNLGVFSRERTIRAMQASIMEAFSSADVNEAVLRDAAQNLIQAFYKELGGRKHAGAFMAALRVAVSAFDAEGVPVELLQNYISVLRCLALPGVRRSFRLLRAEDIWAQGRVMLSESASRLRDAANIKSVAQERALSQLGAKLATTLDTGGILKILQQDLPKLGIPAFWLGLYDGGEGWDRKTIPGHIKVLTAFNAQGAIRMDARLAAADFIPRALAACSGRQSLMAMPLHFNDTQIGVALFSIGPREGSVYEALKIQLSSALYGTLLRQTLKETLTTMETKVAEVSGNSGRINQGVQGGSAAMEEVAHSSHEIARSIKEVMQVIDQAVSLSTAAGRDMEVLNQRAHEIGNIVGVISEIAKKTNMLSLNAAIEAARAGESGRGFAVVADEVKSLAHNTVNSSANIRDMIGSVQENTEQATHSMSGVTEIMRRISVLSAGISSAIYQQENSTTEISSVLHEAALGTNEIAEVLAEIDTISKNASNI